MVDAAGGAGKDLTEADIARHEPLGVQARLRELDRSLPSTRFKLGVVRWLYLPLLSITLVAMVVGIVMGVGDLWPMVGGAAALAGAVGTFVGVVRRLSDDVDDLEDERDTWLEALSAGEGEGGS